MSSNVKDAVVEEVTETENLLANPEGKSVDELIEIVKVLQVQANDANTKANQYQSLMNREITTRTKAQGGIEVVLQLIPKDRIHELIGKEEEEAKDDN